MNLLNLSIEQIGQGAPTAFRLTGVMNPPTEMRGEVVEGKFQAIITEHW
jgi:hypothetical protein